MKKIVFTAGSHGNFLTYLFESYGQGKLLPVDWGSNGNAHFQDRDKTKISTLPNYKHSECYDWCTEWVKKQFFKQDNGEDCFAIVWNGLFDFFYTVQSFFDRGGFLVENGIELLQKNILEYNKQLGMPTNVLDVLEQEFRWNVKKQGQPPRSVLRNYFLLTFYTYFKHINWIENEKLKSSNYFKIQMTTLLNYDDLSRLLENIFNIQIDFKNVHKDWIEKNKPLKQVKLIETILQAIQDTKNIDIEDLNIISEAFLLYKLDCDHYNIPFFVGDNFFKNTKQIIEYINHFPNYMKTPNNFFKTFHQIYNNNKDVDLQR